ncbi:hypothetical protein FSP39_018742 [Pinctada imbricata]|uniref:Signal recognition particle subunit SRP72 n=1 Tax=Pinctada imbricata TaxID=66713 RepID=A0AA89C1Q7_PINIB|nr:hypothetical protein FSP39_018742 [Pinctada imbricata]
MSKPKEQTNFAALYADLSRFSQSQEYQRALKVANRIVHEAPKDSKGFQCKIVLLLKLERFEDALVQINKNKELEDFVKFEKAYCEYRLNKTEEALATLSTLYRLEKYQECYDLYRDVIKNSEDDFDEERETNLSAVIASLQLWSGQEMENPGFKEHSYEICYNTACYLIGKGDFKAAEQKLRRAEVFCRKSFEDDPDVTEEEIEDELAIIRVQLAFTLQKLGKNEEAMQLYNLVFKNKPSDVGLVAVASNNVVTLNKDQNVFDSKKKMKAATAENLKQKLTAQQKQKININQCLLHMYSNQGQQCHQLAAQLTTDYPELDSPVLIEAAQYAKEKNLDKAIQMLQDYVEDNPEKAVSTKLVMVQLHLTQGGVYKACDCLKSLGDLQYKQGVVSALVTLYLSQEDKDSASEVLVKTVKWYKANQPKSKDLPVILKANADFHLKIGEPKIAAEMFEDLRKQNPKDSRVLAQLITAYSQFDPDKAKSLSKDLPSVGEIAQDIDVDQLEASFSTLGPKYMKKKGDTQPSPGPSGDMIITKSKKKRKKKGKMPKNPDAELDPERWLPRRERSYYRGKRRDKRKDIFKGSQGAAQASADLDASKTATPGSGSEAGSPRPGSVASPTPTPTPGPQVQGPRQQKPAQAQKKKKKKGGGKW